MSRGGWQGVKYSSDAERFWAKVDTSGGPEACWPWKGAKDKFGYGNFHTTRGGKGYMEKAHRYAFELEKGKLPQGMCALHDCPDGDDPACCNPAHLWAGSRKANNRDRAQKGRSAHLLGETCPSHRLTESQVREIRNLCRAGTPKSVIAQMFNISHVTVGHIERRQTWKHVL